MCKYTIVQYGVIHHNIGFAIWPDLTRTQSLNYAIKTRSTVYSVAFYKKELNQKTTISGLYNTLYLPWYPWPFAQVHI